MTPQRFQVRRTKGWRKPEGGVICSRPSRWGNPFAPIQVNGFWCVGRKFAREHAPYVLPGHEHDTYSGALDDCIRLYRVMIECAADDIDVAPVDYLAELRGIDLGCWCPLDAPCHVDVLLELANG